MERKPKCTVEEKVSAVEDYLNGTRPAPEIMIDLSIKSTRTIRNWMPKTTKNSAISISLSHLQKTGSGRLRQKRSMSLNCIQQIKSFGGKNDLGNDDN